MHHFQKIKNRAINDHGFTHTLFIIECWSFLHRTHGSVATPEHHHHAGGSGIDALTAANINFVAFWRFHPSSEEVSGLAMVVFAIAIAAAEAAVGLALAISIYRHYRSTNPENMGDLKG